MSTKEYSNYFSPGVQFRQSIEEKAPVRLPLGNIVQKQDQQLVKSHRLGDHDANWRANKKGGKGFQEPLFSSGPDLGAYRQVVDDFVLMGIVPVPCSVYPERVTEYPIGDDLYDMVGKERKAAKPATRWTSAPTKTCWSDSLLSSTRQNQDYSPFSNSPECPGTKFGGRPAIQRKGRRFDHLVTFSSYEFDRCEFLRWLAIEDQRLLAPPGELLTEPQLHAGLKTHPLMQPAGMELGRSQRAHVYLCRDGLPGEVWGFVGD